MDNHPTPFPGKSQSIRSKNPRTSIATKISAKEKESQLPVNRERRAFGTVQNPNMPAKPVARKTLTEKKPWLRVSQMPPAAVTTPPPKIAPPVPAPPTETAQKSPEMNRAKPKKKSVNFDNKSGGSAAKNSGDGDVVDPPTPVKSPLSNKPRVSGSTPYHTAQKCSNCRFDRLESSSYWVSQIKLSESVKKHFASVAFFRLAFESKAEPMRNLRVELKKYLARHNYLAHVDEWRDVSRSYGLLKDESNEVEVGSGCEMAGLGILDSMQGAGNGQIKEWELREEAAEVAETNNN